MVGVASIIAHKEADTDFHDLAPNVEIRQPIEGTTRSMSVPAPYHAAMLKPLAAIDGRSHIVNPCSLMESVLGYSHRGFSHTAAAGQFSCIPAIFHWTTRGLSYHPIFRTNPLSHDTAR